ncbi:hypothetical protein EZJ49_06585 [Bdellovibrio bacteriovorus]|uniref:hypothetical protein n=1 Tax=Bdellovibrio bacteriovorus TaxID=959 RepID=UPI0021D36270|nr:hypothetical protein [Bdellovibrio bacteriovorus]UXR65912.1 hypothetical protein EZJ49_06585 [Bdellovibrio bacteriovorus]
MKPKSLMVLSGLILSTTAAQADCFLDRASTYQCYFPKQITCTQQADPAKGTSQRSLVLNHDEQGNVSYQYSNWVAGKCPSRNCGSDVEYNYEGAGNQPGKTGSVNNYNDLQLVASVANPNGLEFLVILDHSIPHELTSLIPTKLQTLQIQGVDVTGDGAKWVCH